MKKRAANKISADAYKVRLGKRMKSVRIAHGYTSGEIFAYEKGLNRAQYGKYESGKGNITFSNLIKILTALDISLKEFFSEGFD